MSKDEHLPIQYYDHLIRDSNNFPIPYPLGVHSLNISKKISNKSIYCKSRLYSQLGWQKIDFKSFLYKQGYEWYIEFEDNLAGSIKKFSIWGSRPKYLKIIIEFDIPMLELLEYLAELNISDSALKLYYSNIISGGLSHNCIIEEYSNGNIFIIDNNKKEPFSVNRLNNDFKKLVKMILYNHEICFPNRFHIDSDKEFYYFEEMCLSGTWYWENISWKNPIFQVPIEEAKAKTLLDFENILRKKQENYKEKNIKNKHLTKTVSEDSLQIPSIVKQHKSSSFRELKPNNDKSRTRTNSYNNKNIDSSQSSRTLSLSTTTSPVSPRSSLTSTPSSLSSLSSPSTQITHISQSTQITQITSHSDPDLPRLKEEEINKKKQEKIQEKDIEENKKEKSSGKSINLTLNLFNLNKSSDEMSSPRNSSPRNSAPRGVDNVPDDIKYSPERKKPLIMDTNNYTSFNEQIASYEEQQQQKNKPVKSGSSRWFNFSKN